MAGFIFIIDWVVVEVLLFIATVVEHESIEDLERRMDPSDKYSASK
jgi:hypothetical protein